MKKNITYSFLILITLLLITNPSKSILYAKNALDLCTQIIIPSLFPFFVCTGLLISSGFCDILARITKPLMKPLFNISPGGSAAFILGILSGYPLGAACTVQLYQNNYISREEAERLLAFCNNSGPLFILGAVGISVFHSLRAGIILYTAHILGAVSVGILFRFYKKTQYAESKIKNSEKTGNFSDIFSSAIKNSVKNMLIVCATVIFCSVTANLFIDLFPVNETVKALMNSLFEFVSGIKKISFLDIDTFSKLILSAFICAFAGISVHMQVIGVVSESNLSLKPYFYGKILHACFSSVYTFILLELFPVTEFVFMNISTERRISAGFFIISLYSVICCLIIISMLLLFLFRNFKKITIKKSHIPV